MRVNEQTANIGARRRRTVLEKLLDDCAFDAPDTSGAMLIGAAHVRDKLAAIAGNSAVFNFISQAARRRAIGRGSDRWAACGDGTDALDRGRSELAETADFPTVRAG
jgi:hypothetical protein